MNYHMSSQKSVQNTLTSEQLNQVIEAITDGRYSWACVLILRFVGHNPLHFIPQRTYSRLMKENKQVSHTPTTTSANNLHPTVASSMNRVSSVAAVYSSTFH